MVEFISNGGRAPATCRARPPGDITIPAGVFTTGKTYSIRAHCYRGGFPGLASGDFSQRDLPLSVGYLDSGVFTVAAP